ncbi:zeta toxin family protein [Cyanobacterium aponinum UTEX 3222]|uniref:zeta toxin family protein n=1 Tax=Cyanobacterium aponinum TaxID=379064 RepID=UPI003084C096|nr:zeta toxin family protein [Cyanobacterium aponinum UTEX 3222]
MPDIYIISGANGSGKTTCAMTILPQFLQIMEFVNADEIAKGISPFNPESVAIQAGKIMLERLDLLTSQKKDFAFETTLSSRHYARFLRKCRQMGYRINLLYFWLQCPELAISRVKRRVESGGHNIPEDVIIRRYQRGLINLFKLYLPLCDDWLIFDNSKLSTVLIARYNQEIGLTIDNQLLWESMQELIKNQ